MNERTSRITCRLQFLLYPGNGVVRMNAATRVPIKRYNHAVTWATRHFISLISISKKYESNFKEISKLHLLVVIYEYTCTSGQRKHRVYCIQLLVPGTNTHVTVVCDTSSQTNPVFCSQCSCCIPEAGLPDRGSDDDDNETNSLPSEEEGSLYEPSVESDSDESCDELQSSDEDDEPATNRQYFVFWSSLLQLFHLIRCVICGQVANTVRKTVCGTMLRVYLICQVCHSETKWTSQPSLPNGAPIGNIMLSTAILTTVKGTSCVAPYVCRCLQ